MKASDRLRACAMRADGGFACKEDAEFQRALAERLDSIADLLNFEFEDSYIPR